MSANPEVVERRNAGPLGILLFGACVFGAAYGLLHKFNPDDSSTEIGTMLDANGNLRPVAEIAKSIAAAKLITVEVETNVSSTAEDSTWRGTARAKVESPVKLCYGVDLQNADARSLDLWAGARWLFLTVPEPKLIAVQTDLQRMQEQIDVSGLRLRSRSGDTQRQLATKKLDDEARRLALTPEQRLEIEDKTRAQLEKLISTLVANRYEVKIAFAKE